jgi:hypothetical protein
MMLKRADPDIALISDYIAEELSPEEMERVERRLVSDAAFFDKVWPLVQACDQLHDDPPPEATAAIKRDVRRTSREPSWWLRAASAIAAVVLFSMLPQAATVWTSREHSLQLELTEGRASTAGLWLRKQVDSRGDSTVVDVHDARVVLGRDSRITMGRLHTDGLTAWVALDGNARIDITSGTVALHTATAEIRAGKGSLRVIARPATDTTEVRAITGDACVRGLWAGAECVTVAPGQTATVDKWGRVSLDTNRRIDR